MSKSGADLLLKRGDGADPEQFTTVGILQDGTVSFNGNPIDVTTKGDKAPDGSVWQKYTQGIKSMEVAASGIGDDSGQAKVIYVDFDENNDVNYQVVIPGVGAWVSAMTIGNCEFTSPVDNIIGFKMSLMPAGVPTFTVEA